MLTSYFAGVGFDPQSVDTLARSFTPREFRKGEHFVQEGRTSTHLGFVESGLFQYYLLVDGEERTTHTISGGKFIASLVSLFKSVPARENIRAVVDSVVWILEKSTLTSLQQEVPGFKDFYIGLLEWEIGCIDDSRLDGLMLNAQQRYHKLLEEEPHLLQQIPLHYLASMLGVTPRHLSRIRKTVR
jgi:CRP-like cAMP-binding protein